MSEEKLAEISELLQKGKAPDVAAAVKELLVERLGDDAPAGDDLEQLQQAAIAKKTPVGDILTQGLLAGMDVIGGKFKRNEVYVPEVLIAARAMHAGMDVMKPILAEAEDVTSAGTAIVGTVKGDLHDIGKNLVCMMLQGGGFDVVDIGVDVPAERFVEEAKKNNADVVGCSALLTTTMPQMKDVVTAIKESGVATKVIIGGAPVTQAYADEIGADGYAPDAASAVDAAKAAM